MNRTAFKIAATTSIAAMTMVACTAQSEAMRRQFSPTRANAPSDRQAAQHYENARTALQQGHLAAALEAIENAVAMSPRDAGYRQLMAEIYLRSGRFESARTSFADVIELDPSNVRAAFRLALMDIARGHDVSAIALLEQLSDRAAPADIGLAYALAGQPQRGIEILEPAARGVEATPRLRQNLASAHALAGDWQRARAVAAQDISPADLAGRLQQWAAMARPGGARTQVASMIGVTPTQDPGQPTRLALSPAEIQPAAPEQGLAQAEAPAPAGVASAPIQVAAASPAPAPAPAPQADTVSDWGRPAPAEDTAAVAVAEPASPGERAAEAASYYLPPAAPAQAEPTRPASQAAVRLAVAAQSISRPHPALVRSVRAALPVEPVFRRAVPRPVDAGVRPGNSRFVVQLGAFSNEGNAERAWQQAERRFGLHGKAPLTTTFQAGGRTLHRVSVAGFASQTDAARLCGAIRGHGGTCFVRASAGDASIRWAARYAPSRTRRV